MVYRDLPAVRYKKRSGEVDKLKGQLSKLMEIGERVVEGREWDKGCSPRSLYFNRKLNTAADEMKKELSAIKNSQR